MLADELLCPFAGRMLLERAHVMSMSIVGTVMGVLVYTVPSAFLPEIRERLPNVSVHAQEGLGREPGLFCSTECRYLKL